MAREPIIRPNKATLLSWMRDQTITLVPVGDYKPPVVEPIDPSKVRDLKHEDGSIWSWQLAWLGLPAYGLATYSFRYPHRGEMNLYKVEIKYRWWPTFGSFRREVESVGIVGPRNARPPSVASK